MWWGKLTPEETQFETASGASAATDIPEHDGQRYDGDFENDLNDDNTPTFLRVSHPFQGG